MVRVLLAADSAESLLKRLDPELRAKVILTLLGLTLLGLALLAAVWIGGRRVRRMSAKPYQPPQGPPDAWAKKPLVANDQDSLSDDAEE